MDQSPRRHRRPSERADDDLRRRRVRRGRRSAALSRLGHRADGRPVSLRRSGILLGDPDRRPPCRRDAGGGRAARTGRGGGTRGGPAREALRLSHLEEHSSRGCAPVPGGAATSGAAAARPHRVHRAPRVSVLGSASDGGARRHQGFDDSRRGTSRRSPAISLERPNGEFKARVPADYDLPARYISPDGAGRPPAGSSVTANTSTFWTPVSGGTRRPPAPLASTPNTPAETGAFFPAMAQSWYVLPDGGTG